MEKFFKQSLSFLLAISILFTFVPAAEPSEKITSALGIQAAAASADKRTSGNITGIITAWEPAIILNGTGEPPVGTLEIDGFFYALKDTNLLSRDEAEKYVTEKTPVIVHIADSCITSISLLTEENTSISAKITAENIEYDDNGSFLKRKKAELTAFIENKKVADSWTDKDKTNLEQWLKLYNLCTYENISLELQSSDKEKLFFRENFSDSLYTVLDVSDSIAAGEDIEISTDIYVNTEYEPQKGEEDVPILYTLYTESDGTKKIIDSGKFLIKIINNTYEEPPEIQRLSVYQLLEILYAEFHNYHTFKLGAKIYLSSAFAAAGIGKDLTNLQGIYDSFEMLKVGIDVNNMICRADINGLIFEASDAYLSSLFEEIEEEAKTLTGYTDSAIERLLSSQAFKDYIKWYEKNYGYLNGYSTLVEVKCPTDVTVTDEDGVTALTIINNAVTVYDTEIYAETENGEKLFYLPSNIDYKIEITATDDGTMDYVISSVTPGGAARTITYNDVPLITGEAYTATIPCDIISPTKEYNLTSEAGEITEADSDTLPPVESNAADFIVAEELFENFSAEAINTVSEALLGLQPAVNLSEHKITPGDCVALFSAVSKKHPVEYSLITNGCFSYKIIYNSYSGYITEIRFEYDGSITVEKLNEKAAAVNNVIAAVTEKTETMDDFEKALYIHDYIVLNCRYDTELIKILENDGVLSGELRADRYSEYSVLVNGTGICGSYALAYRTLMNAAEAECLYVSSSSMNHAWNMVKIDEEWYHVDCCWDDPVPDRAGKAGRNYFLRTDKEMMELNHKEWTPGQYKATNEKYSSMPRLYDTCQKYDYDNDCWYYLLSDGIYKADSFGENKKKLTDRISGSIIACDGGSIYCSEGMFVYEYDTAKEKWLPVYYLSDEDAGYYEDAYIVNFSIDNESISLYKHIQEYNSTLEEYEIKTVYAEDTLKRDFFNSITGITLNYSELEIELFDNEYLYAELTSDYDTYDLDIQWSSSDENVATVSEWGTVTACNKGTAIITATFMDYSASCTVTVTGDDYSGSCGSKITWHFDTGSKALTLTGSGTMPDYTSTSAPWYSFRNEINAIVIESGITSFGDYAFYSCRNAESITIPEGITVIGDYALAYCNALKEINLPSSVKYIYRNAFEWCSSIEEIEIPDGIDMIYNYTFKGCTSLKAISLPESVVQLAQGAFAHCTSLESISLPSKLTIISAQAFFCCSSLKTLHIPASVTSLSANAFQSCDGMESFTADEESTYLSADEYGVLFNKKQTTLVSYPSGSEHTSYTVPATVTSLNYYAFENAVNLESVFLPEGITALKLNAFKGCTGIKEITIPGSVTTIANSVFEDCTSLERVVIKEGVTYLGSYMFKDCESLKSVTLPESLETINSYSFFLCTSLKSIVLPSSLTTIENNAFHHCNSLNHIAYRCSEEEVTAISVGSYNTGITDAAYIHYSFNEADVISVSEAKPTCTESGMTEGVYCTVCEYTLSGEVIEATGHSYIITEDSKGSCTEAPYRIYTCSTCEDSYTEYGSISGGHRYEADVIAPTCTAPGYTLSVCTVCDETVISDFVSPTGHNLILRHFEDYCENHGTVTYYCRSCDYEEIVSSNNTEADTKTTSTPATCTAAGEVRELCLLCGTTVSSELIRPEGHSFSEEWTIDKEATASEKGEKSRHCIKCDARRDITEIDIILCEHKNTRIINAKTATCKDEGYTGDTVCECGVTVLCGEPIPKTDDHKGGTAFCTKKAVCTVCGDTYGAENPLNHIEKIIELTNPTCTKEGLSDGIVCSLCDNVIKEQKTIPAFGHRDDNEDYFCDFGCGTEYPKPASPSENCPHICHKDGIYRFINIILKIIYKAFGIYPVCSCGEAHY